MSNDLERGDRPLSLLLGPDSTARETIDIRFARILVHALRIIPQPLFRLLSEDVLTIDPKSDGQTVAFYVSRADDSRFWSETISYGPFILVRREVREPLEVEMGESRWGRWKGWKKLDETMEVDAGLGFKIYALGSKMIARSSRFPWRRFKPAETFFLIPEDKIPADFGDLDVSQRIAHLGRYI